MPDKQVQQTPVFERRLARSRSRSPSLAEEFDRFPIMIPDGRGSASPTDNSRRASRISITDVFTVRRLFEMGTTRSCFVWGACGVVWRVCGLCPRRVWPGRRRVSTPKAPGPAAGCCCTCAHAHAPPLSKLFPIGLAEPWARLPCLPCACAPAGDHQERGDEPQRLARERGHRGRQHPVQRMLRNAPRRYRADNTQPFGALAAAGTPLLQHTLQLAHACAHARRAAGGGLHCFTDRHSKGGTTGLKLDLPLTVPEA